MKLFNSEFLEQYFDFIMGEVEKGESFLIEHEGKQVVMVPYKDYHDAQEVINSQQSE